MSVKFITTHSTGIQRTSIKERRLKYFIVKKETWTLEGSQPVEMESAYTLDGNYIGEVHHAKTLTRKYGIVEFQKRTPTSNVCSMGFNPQKQRWFGWSHRAISGFGIGDNVFDRNTGASHPTQKITTIEEAKESARLFAESVS